MPVINRVVHFGLQNFARCKAEAAYPQLWDGLVGLWSPHVNPPGGATLYDWSPYQRNGTLTNMDPASDWLVSQGGRMLDLDGSDDYVLLPSLGTVNAPFTIVADVKPTPTLGGIYGVIVGLRDDYRDALSCGFSGGPNVLFGDHNGGAGLWDTVTIHDGAWHQLIAVAETSTSATLYYDGVSLGTQTGLSAIGGAWTTTPKIGEFSTILGRRYTGPISQIAIYSRRFSASEAALYYSLGRGGIFTPKRRGLLLRSQQLHAGSLVNSQSLKSKFQGLVA